MTEPKRFSLIGILGNDREVLRESFPAVSAEDARRQAMEYVRLHHLTNFEKFRVECKETVATFGIEEVGIAGAVAAPRRS